MSEERNNPSTPTSPWAATALNKDEARMFSPSVLFTKEDKTTLCDTFGNVMDIKTIALQEVYNSPQGKVINIFNTIDGFLPLRIVNCYDEERNDNDELYQLKCHGIDHSGNCVKVIFGNNPDHPKMSRNVAWALKHCFCIGKNDEKKCLNKVFIFKEIRIKNVLEKNRHLFSGMYKMELWPSPYHNFKEAEASEEHNDIPYVSMHAINMERIVPKGLVMGDVRPNIDVFGYIVEFHYIYDEERGPCTENSLNMMIADENDNQIFIQARSSLAWRRKKFINYIGGVKKVIGLRNLTYSHGPHGRVKTELVTYFFTHESEAYENEQLDTIYMRGKENFDKFYRKNVVEEKVLKRKANND